MNSLSLYMIVKNREKDIQNALKNAHLYANEIVIVDTGSTDNTKKIARQFTKNIYDFPWIDDFAAARNFAADKCTKDFIFLLDSDDTISNEDAKKFRALMEGEITWDVCFLPYVIFDTNGNVASVINRERIIRNNKKIYFKYPVHEILDFSNVGLTAIENIKINHKIPLENEVYSPRNLKILEKAMKKNEYMNSPRMWWNLAREYNWNGKYKNALDAYKKAIEKVSENLDDLGVDHQAMIYYEYGQLFQQNGMYNQALELYKTAFDIFPNWREPLFEAAICEYALKNYQKSLELLLKIKDIQMPLNVENKSVYDGFEYFDWLSLAYAAVGQFDNAVIAVNKALEFSPKDERLLDNKKQWLSLNRNTDISKTKKMKTDMTMLVALANPMMSEEKLINIYYLVQKVLDNGVKGDFVEFGTFEGKTAILMQKLLDNYSDNRQQHVYDSFEGLPSKHAQDSDTPYIEGDCKTTESALIANFKNFGAKVPIIHKAWFKDLKKKDLPSKIAFAHVDGDFYTSIIDALEKIYPLLSIGAVVVIDDYCDPEKINRWNLLPGVKNACDDFFKDKKEKVEPLLAGNSAQGFFIKQ